MGSTCVLGGRFENATLSWILKVKGFIPGVIVDFVSEAFITG
jgi:hypothetical protein